MQKKNGYMNKAGGKKAVFGKKEKKRLCQLCVCICLFAVIFFSRSNELFREKQAGDRLLQLVRENTNFTAVFSSLGDSLSTGEAFWHGIETLLTDLFGVKITDELTPERVVVATGPAYENTIQKISTPVSTDSIAQFLGVQPSNGFASGSTEEENLQPVEIPAGAQGEGSVDEKPETEVQESILYVGPELPANATMDRVVLGIDTIKVPVNGEISSGFGYRNHPLMQEHSFHAGIDIAADTGTPIVAFADGIVEFIGESKKYGLYIQLDHGNGVKTFYCHCSELLYGKGKKVEAGQTIALVGDTGDTTGSHLHLELKKDGILLNPAYYINLDS